MQCNRVRTEMNFTETIKQILCVCFSSAVFSATATQHEGMANRPLMAASQIAAASKYLLTNERTAAAAAVRQKKKVLNI